MLARMVAAAEMNSLCRGGVMGGGGLLKGEKGGGEGGCERRC